jgi:shikimate dehydrogenase
MQDTRHETYRLGLIGYPLEHSLSPEIHAVALGALGLVGEYNLYPVPPFPAGESILQELLAAMRAGDLQGLNVTIPHKENVLPLLDELTPVAEAIGAVNTIFVDSVRLTGDNTDASGFLADLKRRFGLLTCWGLHALVLGAGGSARAVTYALLHEGCRVTIASRRIEAARGLSEALSTAENQVGVTMLDPSLDVERLAPVSLVINCTPVGMYPHAQASPWPRGVSFPPGAMIYDLVYNPRETRLVREARLAGLRAVTGLGMLVEQAALAFERWTGRQVPRRPLYNAAESRFSEETG